MSQTKTPKIILNGHLDVVPAKTDQFKPKIVGDKLYARGAQDMKAAAVVMMKVFKELSQDPSFPKDKLGLMLVTDEEIGGHNGTKALIEKGYKADFVIAGESTDLDLETTAKGVLWIKLTSKGKAAHGAYPWEGKNAINPLVNAVQNIQKLYPLPEKEIWETTCNIASIQGGGATNRVPDACELKLDIRYLPEEKPDEIVQKIKNNIPIGVKLEVFMKEPPVLTKIDDPFLKSLANSVKQITGKNPNFIKKHGASDARFFSEEGIPTTCFGPVGAGQHSDNEWVSLKSLSQFEKILNNFILEV